MQNTVEKQPQDSPGTVPERPRTYPGAACQLLQGITEAVVGQQARSKNEKGAVKLIKYGKKCVIHAFYL